MKDTPKAIQTITVYCGSADGINPAYYQAADAMGRTLAQAGIQLVYGGGKIGLMGAVASGALAGGGQVTGVITAHLNQPQLIHAELTRLDVVENMHQRKARMFELADAFIALPGGYGTFEELFETLTWAQLGLHAKPIGLLNTRRYYDPLLEIVQHALVEGFIYAEHPTLLLSSDQPGGLLQMLQQYQAPRNLDRWINRE
jgi:uncharacterized protein (TIGR00730 family)